VPVNVTLLFSREQYLNAADAFLRGIQRPLLAGLNPNVGSVASVFVSRWDAAVRDQVPDALRNRLGIAMRTYKAGAGSADRSTVAEVQCPSATASLGEHGDEGSHGIRHLVYQITGYSRHRQYHARSYVIAPSTCIFWTQ
jgi:hypothetical protein